MEEGREYAASGLDYRKIQPFKDLIKQAGKKTFTFPNKRGVFVLDDNECYEYRGKERVHCWRSIHEGLGNKDWAAQWMKQFAPAPEISGFYGIAYDLAMMGANDALARGALPVIYMDETIPRTSEWYQDNQRNQDFVNGTIDACEDCGMALIGGESPSYKYLVQAMPPVGDTPVLSCTVIGIIAPASRRITGEQLRLGNVIIGAASSGWHSNGATLIFERALQLPDQFMTKLPDGYTLGHHTLIPTRCYVGLVEAWLDAGLEIHALQPVTGDGVGKIAFDKRPFTYRIKNWPKKIPPIFPFIKETLKVSILGCLNTFNWGIGFVGFFPRREVNRAMDVGIKAGFEMYELGGVEEGKRGVIFGPEGDIFVPPPGD
ncbi:MAG: AIR synthase related protein [Candidatus Helarchaeota archaeon]|nr:AIR synthase related protein [Candidatus Helarchaeota archaeon]